MYIIQELAELATKATDQAEESEGKFKSCIAEKENLLQKFADEKQELLDKLNQLQDVISDKDQELKVSNHLFCKQGMWHKPRSLFFSFAVLILFKFQGFFFVNFWIYCNYIESFSMNFFYPRSVYTQVRGFSALRES